LLPQSTGVCDTMHSLGLAGAGGPLPEVDLSEELALMQVRCCCSGVASSCLPAAPRNACSWCSQARKCQGAHCCLGASLLWGSNFESKASVALNSMRPPQSLATLQQPWPRKGAT
jgi:hypothetical protein